jgi:glutaredoxin 3
MNDITVYTKSACPNCMVAKSLLKAKGLSFSEVNIDDPVERLKFLNANPDVRQMPQIFSGDRRIGGLPELQRELRGV